MQYLGPNSSTTAPYSSTPVASTYMNYFDSTSTSTVSGYENNPYNNSYFPIDQTTCYTWLRMAEYIYGHNEYIYKPIIEQPQLSPEQKLAKEREKKLAEEDERTAKVVAKALLLEHLDENNKKRFLCNQSIEIPSKIFGDIKYNILLSKTAKINALKGDKIVDRLCLLLKEPEPLPLEDVILAKVLHILYNEEDMIRIANHFSDNLEDGENLLVRLN